MIRPDRPVSFYGAPEPLPFALRRYRLIREKARPPRMQVRAANALRLSYSEWVENQIENYKESVSRSDLLRLAEEVVAELNISRSGQYQLTELLLLEAVDRKIFQLLKLPGFRAWCAANPILLHEVDVS